MVDGRHGGVVVVEVDLGELALYRLGQLVVGDDQLQLPRACSRDGCQTLIEGSRDVRRRDDDIKPSCTLSRS